MADTEHNQGIESGELRPILGMDPNGLALADLSQSERPVLQWLSIDLLLINGAYQRSLSEASKRSIRRIVKSFDWARLKALSVTPVDGGYFEVVDGQHTAIAAATHGEIDELPCLVSASRDLSQRAGDFVGLNKDRVAIHPLQLYRAELAAGDEIATEVDKGVKSGGGRVVLSTSEAGLRPGDTCAIQALKSLARQGGPAYVTRIVALGVQAGLAPLTANMIGAFKVLIWEDEFSDLTNEAICSVFRIYEEKKLVDRARDLKSDTAALSLRRALAVVIARLAR